MAEEKTKPPVLSADAAPARARRYCAYQERSHQELRDKLYGWGLHRREVERLIAAMIEEGYLNEERFAAAYAGGKFRMKSWGRVRIRQALKQKKVSEYNIDKALHGIEESEYLQKLRRVLDTCARKNPLKDPFLNKQRLARYAISRGFEPDLVWDLLSGQSR
jgi:regulatory protein